jgi:hypothetical protein
VPEGSAGAVFGGSGCLEKLKRGFDGMGRVAASFGVGRKERLSTEATLIPLAILHVAWRSPAVALAAPAAPCSALSALGWRRRAAVERPMQTQTWHWRRSPCAAGCRCPSSSGTCGRGLLWRHG